MWIECAYSVSDEKWGRWLQRAVRLPTEHLEAQLAFPVGLDPVVWRTETSMTAEAAPLRTAPARREENGMRVFTWPTSTPALHAQYRLEWRFEARPELNNRELRGRRRAVRGGLSFFDVRGMVPRPLTIMVQTTTLDGSTVTTVYERGLARLVAHEIDHLDGLLYTSRMRPGVEPIPVEEYRQTGRVWAYEQ